MSKIYFMFHRIKNFEVCAEEKSKVLLKTTIKKLFNRHPVCTYLCVCVFINKGIN